MIYPWLLLLICLPLIGVLFIMLSKNTNVNDKNFNVLNVGSLTVIADLFLVRHILGIIDITSDKVQLSEIYTWIESPLLQLWLGVDAFSLIIIFAIHIAYLIGFFSVSHKQKDMKYLISFSLIALSMMNGFFVSADMFSFYIFFQSMLIPIFLLIAMFGEIKKENVIFRFFSYNLLSSIILFISTMLIYSLENDNISLNNIQKLQFKGMLALIVWGGIIVSFLSRIPIWPFHYFIASINANLKNPLTFIIVSIMPLTGLYGFVRFWPNAIPFAQIEYTYILEIIGVVTMIFMSLVGLVNKDIQHKLFVYITVYCLLYLQGVLLPTEILKLNIAYSVFSYLIIIASLIYLNSYLERQVNYFDNGGVLCLMPKMLFLYSFMTLTAIGLPLSSMFVNNFIIIAETFNHDLYIGIFIVVSLFLVSASLLQNFYHIKDDGRQTKLCVEDLSNFKFMMMLLVIILLFMSFIKPLWFVF